MIFDYTLSADAQTAFGFNQWKELNKIINPTIRWWLAGGSAMAMFSYRERTMKSRSPFRIKDFDLYVQDHSHFHRCKADLLNAGAKQLVRTSNCETFNVPKGRRMAFGDSKRTWRGYKTGDIFGCRRKPW